MDAMKESPEKNYLLKIYYLKTESEPEVAKFIDEGWVLTVNHISSIAFLPYLPTTPWPPPSTQELFHVRDRDEAALATLYMNTQLVTPSADDCERQEELPHQVHELQTIYFVSRAHYAALDAEIAALQQRPQWPGKYDELRLSQLSDGPLRTFLTRDLPRSAALRDYEREILCLGPLHQYL
jgi:hypothetical protein